MSDPTTYELKHPLTFKLVSADGEERSETIASVELRRPTGKDLLILDEFQEKPMRLTLELIAALTGLTRNQVERMDAEDIGPLGGIAMANVGPGQ